MYQYTSQRVQGINTFRLASSTLGQSMRDFVRHDASPKIRQPLKWRRVAFSLQGAVNLYRSKEVFLPTKKGHFKYPSMCAKCAKAMLTRHVTKQNGGTPLCS